MFYPITDQTGEFAGATIAELERAGLSCGVISTGGTPSAPSLRSVPQATEHRAGAYIFNDRAHIAKGWASWDESAMRIRPRWSAVPRRTGRSSTRSKTLSSDRSAGLVGYGAIIEYPAAVIQTLSEEHGVVDLSQSSRKPEVGEIVTIIPNHTCVVANLHDRLVGSAPGPGGERVAPSPPEAS